MIAPGVTADRMPASLKAVKRRWKIACLSESNEPAQRPNRQLVHGRAGHSEPGWW